MSNETYEERLNEFVLAFSKAENIERIEASLAAEKGISLSICIPKENKSGVNPAKKSIHLLVESKEPMGVFRLVRILAPVKKIMGYDYDEDAAEDRQNILKEYLKDPANPKVGEEFSEIIQIAKFNTANIQRLLEKSYPRILVSGFNINKLSPGFHKK